MTRVVGIDPSLSATAVAALSHDSPEPSFAVISTKPGRGDAPSTLARMREITGRVRYLVAGADLVVVEGLSHRSGGRATRDLAGLWWLLLSALTSDRAPIAICAPSTRAKWATGKGNATKFAVGQAIARRYPDTDIASEDEADALVLASMGAQACGFLPWRPTAFQTKALAAVAWPAEWKAVT